MTSTRRTRTDRSGGLFPQVQVRGVELACFSEALPVQHLVRARLQGDQPLAPEVLQGAVHMYGRDAQRITEFGLRERQPVGMSVRQADRPQAHVKLTQKMGDAPVSFAPTYTPSR